MNFENDELEDITPIASPAVATAVATAVAQPVVNVVIDDNDGAFEMGDETLRPKTRLPNLRPDKGSVTRIFLIKGVKPRAKETHYLVTQNNPKGMTVICPGAGCPECGKGGDHNSRTRIVVLAGKYTNASAKDGKFPAGTQKLEYSIGYLGLSRSSYADVLDLPSEGESVYDVDIRMGHKNSGIGYAFTRLASPCAYTKLKDEATIAELAQAFMDGKDLVSRIGKKMSVIELKMALGGGDEDAALAAIDDID